MRRGTLLAESHPNLPATRAILAVIEIVRERVDPTTGQLATRRCPDSRQEIFVRGAEPVEHCRIHQKEKRRGFWRSLIGRR